MHLILVPGDAGGLRAALGGAHRRYTRQVNLREGWRGYLWQGRFAAVAMDAPYLLAAARYVELNPVRARMVEHPRNYRWSSYRAHAEGREDALAQFHDAFRRLGRTVEERRKAYRELFAQKLDPAFVESLRAATNGGWALGSQRFAREIARAAGRRAAPLPRGPKPAAAKDKRQLSLL